MWVLVPPLHLREAHTSPRGTHNEGEQLQQFTFTRVSDLSLHLGDTGSLKDISDNRTKYSTVTLFEQLQEHLSLSLPHILILHCWGQGCTWKRTVIYKNWGMNIHIFSDMEGWGRVRLVPPLQVITMEIQVITYSVHRGLPTQTLHLLTREESWIRAQGLKCLWHSPNPNP